MKPFPGRYENIHISIGNTQIRIVTSEPDQTLSTLSVLRPSAAPFIHLEQGVVI